MTILQEIVLNKNQAEIAREMGVTPQLLNWMIRNPKKLRAEQIECFASAVKRSPRTIFSLIINN